jgi:hypothetical protein
MWIFMFITLLSILFQYSFSKLTVHKHFKFFETLFLFNFPNLLPNPFFWFLFAFYLSRFPYLISCSFKKCLVRFEIVLETIHVLYSYFNNKCFLLKLDMIFSMCKGDFSFSSQKSWIEIQFQLVKISRLFYKLSDCSHKTICRQLFEEYDS